MESDKKNIAWIEGSYLASFDLLQKIKQKYSEAEYYVFDDNCAISDIVNQIYTESIFATCKVIVLHGMPAMTESEKKTFKDALINMSEKVLFIFFMIDSVKCKAIFSAIESRCKFYRYEAKIANGNVQSYINKKIEDYDLEISSEDLLYLVANLQKTEDGKYIYADTIEMSLRKLMYLDPKRKQYTKEDILLTSSNVNNFIIWDLFAACDNKDMTQCLNMFNECVRNNYSATAALTEVVNVMAWKFRMLLGLKEKIANKCDQKEAIAQVSAIRKIQFVGTGMASKGEVQIVESGSNKGAAASIWNAGLCQQSMQSFYNKTPQIEKYTRKDLYLINDCIQYVMLQLRGCAIDAQAYILADILFATVCSFFNREEIQKLKTAVERMNVYA